MSPARRGRHIQTVDGTASEIVFVQIDSVFVRTAHEHMHTMNLLCDFVVSKSNRCQNWNSKNDSVWNELAGTISNPSWFLVFILFKSKWKMFLFSLFLFCYSVTYLHQIIEIFHLISFSCGLKKKKWKINRYPNMIKLTHAFCWLFSKLYRIFSVLSIFNILLIPL